MSTHKDHRLTCSVFGTGIVLWEMFSLGKTPYPGIEAGERFYDMLVKGYRYRCKYRYRYRYSCSIWAMNTDQPV